MKISGRRESKNVETGKTGSSKTGYKKTSRGSRKIKPKLDVEEVREKKSRSSQESALSEYQKAHGWVSDEAQQAARSKGPRRTVKNVSKALARMYERKIFR